MFFHCSSQSKLLIRHNLVSIDFGNQIHTNAVAAPIISVYSTLFVMIVKQRNMLRLNDRSNCECRFDRLYIDDVESKKAQFTKLCCVCVCECVSKRRSSAKRLRKTVSLYVWNSWTVKCARRRSIKDNWSEWLFATNRRRVLTEKTGQIPSVYIFGLVKLHLKLDIKLLS